VEAVGDGDPERVGGFSTVAWEGNGYGWAEEGGDYCEGDEIPAGGLISFCDEEDADNESCAEYGEAGREESEDWLIEEP